ncbi:MAG: Dyp-type peroxidase [Burkholderiales bacterium]|nr:Dyp-type peroxidase [Burkholderiales bacterium]
MRAEGSEMRAELITKSRTLVGASDLTLLAPVKPGLVPSLDTLTYRTRTKRLLKTLNGGRSSLHEYALVRPLSDGVERVAKIHSFRVTVLELRDLLPEGERVTPPPTDLVLLAVTFDGTWESYIRVLWQRVGPLLDIIFCNTAGYVLSTHSFEAWCGWVQRVQVETAFFFHTHGLTVEDAHALRATEHLQRSGLGPARAELLATRHHLRSAEEIAWRTATASPAAGAEALRQGLQSLAVLYRLTDSYLPHTADGEVLLRAARNLLLEFVPLLQAAPQPVQDMARLRFARQLDWLFSPEVNAGPRPLPPLPPVADTSVLPEVQAGILRPYSGHTHGALLLLGFDTPAAGGRLLQLLLPMVSVASAPPAAGALAVNLAVTYEGLRALGLTEAQLAWFPQEFREGMAARASMLGDYRANHPRRWHLPQRNWRVPAGQPPVAVEMNAVHLLVQLRIGAPGNTVHALDDPAHPLHATLCALLDAPGLAPPAPPAGLQVLSVQAMRRLANAGGETVEHFGFVDGTSDPVFNAAESGPRYPNQVHLGEALLGHANEADFPPQPDPQRPDDAERLGFLRNGSFLVVRKLRQDVAALNEAVAAASTRTGLDGELLLAKMMGRWRAGPALAADGPGNDFHYAQDPEGRRCPLHAHIRRANPRQVALRQGEQPGGRRPRLLRRGMSYGPPQAEAPDAERGLVFMAYNASLSEQFEVVQRWIAGSNSTGGYSGQSDPLLGVPEVGQQRHFRFEHAKSGHPKAYTVALDAAPGVNEAPRPFVRLEWGTYAFAPSLPTLQRLQAIAAAAPAPAAVWSAAEGERRIQALFAAQGQRSEAENIAAWKALLEDPEAQEKYISAGVWAAIRQYHGGVLRTPYGVIVARHDLVMEVLGHGADRISVSGYRARMPASIGEIYLGLDDTSDGRYQALSSATNAAIQSIGEAEAFLLAKAFTGAVVAGYIAGEKKVAALSGAPRWELNLDVKEVSDRVLALLCQWWFGLPESSPHIVRGAWDWNWQPGDPTIYPSQFTAPSRYLFQPHPGDDVQHHGQDIGHALTASLLAWLAPFRDAGTVPPQPPFPGLPAGEPKLAKAILAAFPDRADDGLVARTFTGALMGMLPTVDGNLRLSLNEWLRDGSFWSLRAAWPLATGADELARAKGLLLAPLRAAMQLRPSPELVWRTAVAAGSIGGEGVAAGDRVVLGLVSATQQQLAEGVADVSPVFGGNRTPGSAHPTHACPGYQAGMGILLGMLAALVAVPETMKPSPVPLAFTFDGPMP